MEENKKLIDDISTAIDGVEARLREIWPDDKPDPEDEDSDEARLGICIVFAMVHLTDLRHDLENIELYI